MARVRSLEGDLGSFANEMLSILDEDQKRIFLAAFADYLGYGGATRLSETTGVTQQTISAGRKELNSIRRGEHQLPRMTEGDSGSKRIRAVGGGRKSYAEKHPEILDAIDALLDGNTVGNPENPLRWTTKSTRKLEEILKRDGFDVSYTTIGKILEGMGYSLQQNRKYTESGEPDPDRNSQFEFISSESARCIASIANGLVNGRQEKVKLGWRGFLRRLFKK